MLKTTTICLKSFLLVFLLMPTTISNGQTYGDKAFYLIDSLDIEKIDQYDLTIIDSMLQLYHKEEEEDTLKFGYIEQIIESSWDDALTSKYNNYLKQLVSASLTKNNVPGIRKKVTYFKAVTLGNQGYYFDMESQFDSARSYYEKAYVVFEEINNSSGMGNALYQIALTYKVQGNSVYAIEKFKEAADLCEKVNDYKGLAANYMSIGDILSNVGEYGEAKINYRKAINNAKKVNDIRRVGIVLNDLAQLNLHQENPEEAILYCDSALQRMNEVNFRGGIANVMNTLVTCYIELKDFDQAFKFGKKSLEASKKIENNELLHITYNNLTKVELQREHYNEALKYALEAEQLIEKTKSTSYEKTTVKNLAEIYKFLGKYKLAAAMFERKADLEYQIFNDQIRSKAIKSTYHSRYEKQKEIDDLKNKQQLELANEQKRRTRLGLFGAALLALITGFAAYLIFNRLKIIRQQKLALDSAYAQLEEAKKNELAVSNLKALQSQMNPHFIFNALNSVQDLVLLKDIRNSNRYLGKFSDLIRKILLSSKEQFITLEEEIEILTLYLDLEKLRFGEDFKAQLDCNIPENRKEEIRLPAMFIQPYIENAIKHGLFHKVGEKQLLVSFKLKPNHLECIVQDNGIGQERAAEMKVKNLHLHTGFSTEAIAERIKLLNETLDKKIDLVVEDLIEHNLPTGTKITLLFPVELN